MLVSFVSVAPSSAGSLHGGVASGAVAVAKGAARGVVKTPHAVKVAGKQVGKVPGWAWWTVRHV